jgi:hypothetical protein
VFHLPFFKEISQKNASRQISIICGLLGKSGRGEIGNTGVDGLELLGKQQVLSWRPEKKAAVVSAGIMTFAVFIWPRGAS